MSRFSEPQKKVYEAILGIQRHCIQMCKPGQTLNNIYNVMTMMLAQELCSIGVITKKLKINELNEVSISTSHNGQSPRQITVSPFFHCHLTDSNKIENCSPHNLLKIYLSRSFCVLTTVRPTLPYTVYNMVKLRLTYRYKLPK